MTTSNKTTESITLLTDEQIEERVRKLLYANMIKGESEGFSFHYTRPSPDTYPFQYFWDTCFHVFTLTALGEHEMAKKHMRSLFLMQEEDGFVGHILYWKHSFPARITDIFQLKPKSLLRLTKPHMTALVQPPLVAEAVQRIYTRTKDVAFVKEMLPKLKAYYDWLHRNRDFEGEGLLSIISPYESGMDWKASYDPVLGFRSGVGDWRLFLKVMWLEMKNFGRGYDLQRLYRQDNFIVKDVAFNTIYAQSLQALANLCSVAGDESASIYASRAERTRDSILKYMYHPADKAFYDLAGQRMEQLRICTATIFFPVVLPNVPKQISEAVLQRHLFNPDGFSVPYPIPSLSVHEAAFDAGESVYIWRGPTWVLFNWFMHRYLQQKGYSEEADALLLSVKKMISKSGFREYYNPFTGEGYGAHEFTWSGLVLDMIKGSHHS
ncbi:trehalase family glycosidase [uncultured Pontibacter sp.]|uniref:amylo-alpha-1,6-glucosidase n=1 Tax=uncultured Pontibacter sp. TaxID=453356 RepID=UPI00262F00BC|nr:trehalase family glycosidase [uncultured Pontibacter sp.]